MRPNYVVTAAEDGRLILYGLYYSQRKAKKAFAILQKPSIDGSYTILHEDGGWESTGGHTSRLIVKLRFLGDHIWTTRAQWKKSFFDTTEEEFEELAIERDIPVILLKKIAAYELDFIEDRGDTRWSARKRLYLARRLYSWF
jgi:hypothetical protein